ncbi:hypothetical protein EVAR_29050_1 [Eumeta japonica]|uniref:Uncharacterized protein n=1 Tax=Eumeta variegata TaxID=151549 RepID=A0A4C1W436_EUMVA|nr:hypothetical protein EVAR_29050_1 [Eumeta japonica]
MEGLRPGIDGEVEIEKGNGKSPVSRRGVLKERTYFHLKDRQRTSISSGTAGAHGRRSQLKNHSRKPNHLRPRFVARKLRDDAPAARKKPAHEAG